MEFREDIVKSLIILSEVNRDFLKFVEKNHESMKRSNFKILELHDDLFRLQSWPTFINNKTREIFQEAGEKIFNLVKRIPQRVFNNDVQKMSAYYETPLEQVESEMEGVTEDHIESLVGRGDFIISSSGLKCIEFNIAASMGGWQIPIWEVLYLNNPVISAFLNEKGIKTKNANLLWLFLEHLISSALSRIKGCESEINIAFAAKHSDPVLEKKMTVYLNALLKDILKTNKIDIKGCIFICDYPRLSLKNDCLVYQENRIHTLTEMDLGGVSNEVAKAFQAGNICLINGPITSLLSHKLNLAILSDYESVGVFTDEEKKIIDTYIPWTRKITNEEINYKGKKISDMGNFLQSNKADLVIKPSWGYGGDGVCVGRKCSKEEWDAAVKKTVDGKSWLVQEYVEPSMGIYQTDVEGYDYFDMVWGFFVFGSHYSGAWVRVMPQEGSKGIINCHQGASVSIIFEVDR